MKVGEVWYLRADNSYGYEEAMGRPCLILAGDEKRMGTSDPGVVTISFLTTNPRPMGINIPVKSTRRDSWVLCNQLQSIDARRLRDRMCAVTEEEMNAVRNGLKVALGLTDDSSEEEDVLNLKVELDTYKRMYDRVLGLLVDERIEKDIESKTPEIIVEPPKPEPIEVNTELLKAQMSTPNKLMENELNENPVKTKLKPKKLEPVKTEKGSMIVDSMGRYRRSKGTASVKTMNGKANINKDDWETIVAKTGISYNTAKNIVSYRKKNGPYTGLEELLNVPRFGNGCWDKYIDMMEI